jgi:hypothetical protein
MLTTRTPPQNCTKCGHRLDATTNFANDAIPKVGDLTLCIECLQVFIFEPGMMLREFTKQEMDQLTILELAELYARQQTLRQMHEDRRRANANNN